MLTRGADLNALIGKEFELQGVRFLGTRAVRIVGTASGRQYRVSPERPLVAVDDRDAAALLRSGLFRPVP